MPEISKTAVEAVHITCQPVPQRFKKRHRKDKKDQINNLTLQLKKLEKENKLKQYLVEGRK